MKKSRKQVAWEVDRFLDALDGVPPGAVKLRQALAKHDRQAAAVVLDRLRRYSDWSSLIEGCRSPARILHYGFAWGETEEGHDYWYRLHVKLDVEEAAERKAREDAGAA